MTSNIKSFQDFLLNEAEPFVNNEISKVSESNETTCFQVIFAKNIIPTMQKEVASLPDSSLPFSSLSETKKQILLLKMIKSMFLTLFPGGQIKEVKEFIGQMIGIFEACSLEELMSSTEFLTEWMDEIVTCQNLFKKFLSMPTFDEGNSKGILYKIKKKGITCGYLFGTLHYLITPELLKASKCSSLIYKKLSNCSIIGTEAKVTSNENSLGSVEENFIEFAKTQGIVNFGIDSKERVKTLINLESDETSQKEKNTHEIQEMRQFLEESAKAYQSGDIQRLKFLGEKTFKKQDIELENIRNSCMAKNINAFLEACENAGKKHNEKCPKSFFAIGINHLIINNNIIESIPQKLANMSWEVELVIQK
jgi:hypothetical protein